MAKTETQLADGNQSGESSSNVANHDIKPNTTHVDSAKLSKSKRVDITIEPTLQSFSQRFRRKPPMEEIGIHVHMEDCSDLFPTLSLTRRELKDPAARERLRNATDIGCSFFLGRYALYSFLPVYAFLSKEQEKVFCHVLDALKTTLTHLWVNPTQEDPTLYMSESSYESL